MADDDDDDALAAEWEAMAGDDDGGGDDGGEDMAAEWESMLGDEDEEGEDEPAVGGTSARVLNQDEIDSLLGFDDGSGAGDQSGIQAIINSSMVAYERLPMLEVVFDRLVR
ncbi:MAG: flagellar motor switch protein FliM, partial [Thalassospira sp.]